MRLSDRMLARAARLVVRDDAPIGLIIHDRYRVEDRIARGGMGEIFLARDLRLNRPVAMKILGSRLTDPEWTARFEAEARTMGRIDHPGIVPIHDLGLLPDGRLYYTMKLLDGLTLDALIEAGEKRDVLLRALVRTCRIVHHAHEQGIIHRDLKPTNVMVDENGQTYVLDWGIARVMDEVRISAGEGAMTAVGLTSAGTILGTVQYMPPEQARGDLAAIDARSDVYSLGAILYEMLTGLAPVSGSNVTEILEAASEGRIEPPRDLDPSLPPDLESVCLKALAKRQDDRYPSAKALADDLVRWMAGDPVRAYPGGPAYAAGKFVRKRRALTAVTLVAILSVLGFGGYWIVHREDRALAATKRVEDEIFGPIRVRLDRLPAHPDGWKRGIDLLREGLEKYDRSWSAWMRLGDLHEKRYEYDEALDAFAQALAINSRLGTAHYRRGRIYMQEEETYPEARREFEAALRVEPDNEYALLGRARLSMLNGDFGQALFLCNEAEPIAKHVRDLHFIRGHVFHSRESGRYRDLKKAVEAFTVVIEQDPRAWRAYSSRGIAREESGDPKGAIADYDRAIELHPKAGFVYFNRALARDHAGDIEGALEDYTASIRLRPLHSMSYNNRGNVRKDMGDLKAARADYDRAVELDPRNKRAWYNRGLLKDDLNDPKGAVEDFDRAIEIDPDYAAAYHSRGRVKGESVGDVKGGMKDLARSIELDPNDPLTHHSRGRLHRRLGELKRAVEDYTRAIECKPDFATAYSNRGNVYKTMGKLAEALKDYEKAIGLDPDSAAGWVGKGNVFRRQGRQDDALHAYTRAIEIEPGSPIAYYNRANLRDDRGDVKGAIEDYSKALEIRPVLPEAYANRGHARKKLGRKKEAARDYKRALDTAPPGWRYREYIRKCLEELSP